MWVHPGVLKTPGFDPKSPNGPHLFDLQHFPRCATVDQVQAHLRKVEAAQMMTDIMDGTQWECNNSTDVGVK